MGLCLCIKSAKIDYIDNGFEKLNGTNERERDALSFIGEKVTIWAEGFCGTYEKIR